MASFSYSSFLPNEFVPNFNNNVYHPFENQEGSSFASSCIEQQSIHNNETSTTNTLSEKQRNTGSLSMADKLENADLLTQNCANVDKKRKSRNGSSLNSANSKDANKQVKPKKQKEEKEVKNEKKCQNKAIEKEKEEAPKDYIHVRARRGQATDSHSLAERVRREKIGEKMRTLQSIVPGCDKVTGKALMLDEIINYVQSLQNQVEFLSMKLATVDPMVYTLGLMDLDPMVFGSDVQLQGMNDNNNTVFPIPLMQSIINGNTSGSSTPTQSFATANSCLSSPATSSTLINPTYPNNNPQFDSSTNNLILHEQKPNMLQFQDVGSSYYGVNEQERQTIINQFGLSGNNLYSIQ